MLGGGGGFEFSWGGWEVTETREMLWILCEKKEFWWDFREFWGWFKAEQKIQYTILK